MSPHTCVPCVRSIQRRRKKVTKEKATPSLRPLRVAKGQPAAGRLLGAPWNSLCAGARRSDNHGESVHEAWALRRACSPRNRPAEGAASRGLGTRTSNSRTATRAIASLGPVCATRGACARAFGAERSAAKQWPVWMSAPRVPFRMRRGAQRAGWPVCRRTHRLRDLTCCGCLSGARSAKRVPQHTPPASTAGCPQRSEGTQRVGSPSLW